MASTGGVHCSKYGLHGSDSGLADRRRGHGACSFSGLIGGANACAYRSKNACGQPKPGSFTGLIGGEACSFTGATLLRETSHRPSVLPVVVVLMPVRIALRTHAASRSLGLHGSTWSTWLVPLVKGAVLSDLAICTSKPYFYIILFWSMQLTKQSHLADSNLIESQRTRYWLHLPPKQLLIRSTSTPFTTQ